jgi:hypothetical protein
MDQCCGLLAYGDEQLVYIKGGEFVQKLEILTSVLLKMQKLR